jgi:hypothetical protein
MTQFLNTLKSAFPDDPVPAQLFDNSFVGDPDRTDAALLLGVPWTRIDDEFWLYHWEALTALNIESFIYYLPSAILFSYRDCLKYDMVTDLLTNVLDTSGDLVIMPAFVVDRFGALTSAQFDCLEMWARKLSELCEFRDEIQERRVFNTIRILRDI